MNAPAPELPLELPTRRELLAAWRSVRKKNGRSFADAMREPVLAKCIRNIAHARRLKTKGP